MNHKEENKHAKNTEHEHFIPPTTDLKSRLTEYCLENDLHNSCVIRQALNSYLRQETKEELPRLMVTR